MIGVIGIGNMGLAMALRLRDLGQPVAVRDLDPAREALAAAAGAVVYPTPAALARHCTLVVVAVVDGAQTHAVLFSRPGAQDGVVDGLQPGGTVMLCPTISPEAVSSAAKRLAERGLACIDAPMSGGPARARDGSMSLMVACEDDAWARWQVVLGQLAAHCFRVGQRPGDGARTKLVNNLLAAINLAGAAEALQLAESLGLDAARTLAVIEQSSGQSWIASDRARRVLAGDTAPRAHLRLLAKDSALAMDAARAVGLALPLGAQASEAFAQGCRDGLAEADDSVLWRRP
jgi:3-hydroxyisobutyrate dehydrogenase